MSSRLSICPPHALSVVASLGVAAFTALAQAASPALAPYHGMFLAGAVACGFLAAPNLSKLEGASAWWRSISAALPHTFSGSMALAVAGLTALNDSPSVLFTANVHRVLSILVVLAGMAAAPNLSRIGPSEPAPAPPAPPAASAPLPPSSSTLARTALVALTVTLLTGCVTHVLGATDLQTLRDDMTLQASTVAILANDGGPPPANVSENDLRRIRSSAKVGYCGERQVLLHSNVTVDSGIACEASP